MAVTEVEVEVEVEVDVVVEVVAELLAVCGDTDGDKDCCPPRLSSDADSKSIVFSKSSEEVFSNAIASVLGSAMFSGLRGETGGLLSELDEAVVFPGEGNRRGVLKGE